jgi:hypothetical protein
MKEKNPSAFRVHTIEPRTNIEKEISLSDVLTLLKLATQDDSYRHLCSAEIDMQLYQICSRGCWPLTSPKEQIYHIYR